MTTQGICANATFPESRLTSAAGLGLGVKWQRTITYWGDDRSSWRATIDNARELLGVGISTLVVFNTEASGTAVQDVDLHAERLGEFLDLAAGNVAAIEPGNELDQPAWGISNDLIIQIGRKCGVVCRDRGIGCLSPSLLTGPEEGRFEAIAKGLAGYVTAMAVHPYYCSVGGFPWAGWHFGTVEQKAQVCQERGAGLQTWFTELGCPSTYDGIGLDRQAAFTKALREFQHPAIDVTFLFCLTDAMVPGGELQEGKDWGLADGAFHSKPARAAFARPASLPVQAQPKFVLGFELWHEADPQLLGDPLEDERGGVPGFSQQRTSKGILTAADINGRGWELLFWDSANGARYRFAGGKSERIG